MCTVSFYQDSEKVIITSNRDEKTHRPLAEMPQFENLNGKKIAYPKDPQAGGTWFAVDEHGAAFVLLNGAATPHQPTPPYRKSRGLILTDLAQATDFEEAWREIDLHQIEPFTLIAFQKNKLLENRWNGQEKTSEKIAPFKPTIWSSSTLYTSEIIQQRKEWYEAFLLENQFYLEPSELITFHTTSKQTDPENGLIIQRNNVTLTKNVTQYVLHSNGFTLLHLDLINGKTAELIHTFL